MLDNLVTFYFYSRTVHLDIIKVFNSPTNAQENCLKKNMKIYIKIAPTCFGAITPSSGSALFVLAKVTTVTLASTNNALTYDAVIASKHVGAVLM